MKWHSMGLRAIFYTDNAICPAKSTEECERNRQTLSKSKLSSQQRGGWLGFIVDLVICVPDEKIKKLKCAIRFSGNPGESSRISHMCRP